MSKIKLSEIADGLLHAAQLLRESVANEAHAREKLAQAELSQRADAIVTMAQDKRLDLAPLLGDMPTHQEKVAALVDDHNLDTVESAVKIAGGDLGFGAVGDNSPGGRGYSADSFESPGAAAAAERYASAILGDD